ncbi:hypothetical protein N431DRAFT_471270 [Stipitochalara longipes BDJ]|nr:hypothetical protein N431DRAFT_471270 [Stipitochalara longipes BDJ]
MSAFNNGGGGSGSSGGLPPGITQAQLDEIKSFSAGLTQAGNKSRPSRPRGGDINRGIGSGISPARVRGSYSSASNISRSGNGAVYGGGASYSVGPTTASPITKPNVRENVPTHLRGVVDLSKTRWANLDSTGAGTLGGHSTGPLNSASTPPKSRSRSPTRSSILATQRPQPSPPKLQQQQQPVFQPLQNVEQGQNPITRIPTPPGRVRIVTNMTPDDPSKPFIPAHLRQTSCRKTIEDIAHMTGIPLSEITSDGMSIPAHPSQVTSPTSAFAPLAAPRQVDVDQQNWLNLAKSKKQGNEVNPAVNISNTAGNSSMNDTAANAQPMLSESRWASGGDNTAQKRVFAPAFSTAPTPTAPAAPGLGASVQQAVVSSRPVPLDNGWGPSAASSQVTPASSGWGQSQMIEPQAQAVPANSSSGWDTVGNNRWTQAQPDHGFGNALPAQTSDFGSGSAQVQATSSNANGFGNASTAQFGGFGSGPAQGGTSQFNGFGSAPLTQSAGFGSGPAQGQPLSSTASGFASVTPTQSGGFGSGPAQIQATSSNTNGFIGASTAQSTGFGSAPAQAGPFNTGNSWGPQPGASQSPSAPQSGWGATSHGFQASSAPFMVAQATQAQSSGGWGKVASQNPAAHGPSSGHTRIPSQSMSDVEMTGGNSILDTPIGNLDISNPTNQALTAMPTLADSRWATPSWNAPQESTTAFGRPSQGPAQVSAANRPFEPVRRPLSETAPGGFSFINTQSATPTTVNNSWSTAAASVPPTTPAQSHPFGNFNLADFNNRVARELAQVGTHAQSAQPSHAQAPDYGPAHLRPAPQNINRANPTRSVENIVLKKEEKVQFLKDSRWAY